MNLRPKRPLLWLAAVIIVAAIAFALRPQPVPADFATVGRGSLLVTIDEEGETRVRDRFVVSAPVTGRVLRIDLEPGDRVVAGETIIASVQPASPPLLDARTRAEAAARVSAAEAVLDRARATRDQTRTERDLALSDLKRQRELDEGGLVSVERLEAVETMARAREDAVRAAESAVRTAESELRAARAVLDPDGRREQGPPVVVQAPVTGVVLRRIRESEAIVPAGESLVEIGDPRNLEIVSDLLSTDAVRVREGHAVLIEGWGGDETLRGVVRRVEPSGFTKISALGVEEQRVNVLIDFADPATAWEALGDGYRVEVRVIVWEGEDVLKVETSSLFRLGDEWTVYVVEDGRATRRPVTVGHRNGFEAEILSGLEAGEQIILHPGDAVEDGVAVVARS
jgi:HlyD family secretion protein